MAEHETSRDAIDLLMEDHRTVEGLFARFEAASGGEDKQALARWICRELKVHTLLEEEIFYPSVRGKVDGGLLDASWAEHDAAEVLIHEIEAGWADEAVYTAKLWELKAAVEHHVEVEEDERQGLFVQARKTDLDLRSLGQEMAERRAGLMRDAEHGRPLPAEPRTFQGAEQPVAGGESGQVSPPASHGAPAGPSAG